jgi:hypothetical protein
MRTLHLLVALLLAVCITSATSCVSNPTPHPGSEEFTRGGSRAGTGGMTGEGSLPGNSQNNATTADAAAGPDPSESIDATGPPDTPTCEDLEGDFEEALSPYQGCDTDDACVLLIDESDCNCSLAVAVAVADEDQAQALLDQALACGAAVEALAGGCTVDAAPLGNTVSCQENRCVALIPDESCLTSGDTATTDDTESTTEEDVGPDAVVACEGNAPACVICGSDVELDADCVDGQWTCDEGELDPACSEQTCDLFGGEVCCDSEGTAESALCPSPSQAYCADGSPPVMACGACGDGACDPSESAEDCPEECNP